MKTLNKIADAVHDLAWKKGFHKSLETEDAYIERMCNNLHNEVSELHEAWRNNRLRERCDKPSLVLSCLEEELADIIIRALDNSRRLNIDIQRAVELKHAYNKTRRHGNKKS